MEKIISSVSEQLFNQLMQLGYKPLKAEDYPVFQPYYDAMNEQYSSEISFLSMVTWSTSIFNFYKPMGDMLCCLEYVSKEKYWTASPFIGHYSQQNVETAFRILRKDMQTLHLPLKIMDMSEWMFPFYQGISGISWKVENLRDFMEYIYEREDFFKSMDSPDSRYRYRYFLRHFSPETVLLTSAHSEECTDYMKETWCPVRECSDCCACPLEGVKTLLDAWDSLQANGILVRVNRKCAGFCIVSCQDGLGIYLFKHANNHMKGINEYLLRECLTRFLPDVERINYTADVGIEGLRAYKSKLAPYTLSPCLILYEEK